METFDTGLLRSIETMVHSEARIICLDLIKKSNTKVLKKAALIRDIEAAPNSKELSRIMWNVLLAGEGLAISTSAWQTQYGGTKK
jgi:ATP phosphoribosyltransferase